MIEKGDIIMTKESNEPFLALCYEKGWCAHESYMTKREAANVMSISPWGLYRTMESLEELRYFTGLTSFPVNCYAMRSLKTVCFPPNLTTAAGDSLLRGSYSLEWAVLGQKIKSIGTRCIYQWRNANYPPQNDRASLILMSDTVVSLHSNNTEGAQAVHLIYVPDNLVDSYKADDVWGATYADRIVGISTLPLAQHKYLDWYNYKPVTI